MLVNLRTLNNDSTDGFASATFPGGVLLQVVSRRPQADRVVIQEAKRAIAAATQNTPDYSGPVAVINRGAPHAARSSHGLRGSTYGTVSGLQAKRRPPLRLLRVMPALSLHGETAAALGPESRGVRTSVGVGFGKQHATPGAVRASSSHCPILPARKGSWVRNAVTPCSARDLFAMVSSAVLGEEVTAA